MQQELKVHITWTHFPLHPETPAEGLSLEDLFAGRGMDIAAMKARMAGLMAAEGLEYGDRTKTYNSRLAQEVGKWAATQPGGERIHRALFRGYFVEGINLSSPDALLNIVEAAGLSREAATAVIRGRTYHDAVDADWRRAGELGITGVPTFVVAGYGLVGAQPYEQLVQLVTKARQAPRERSG